MYITKKNGWKLKTERKIINNDTSQLIYDFL